MDCLYYNKTDIFTLGEICMMTEMGWLSKEHDMISLDSDTVMADISSLPTEVAVHLTGTKFEMCVAKIGRKLSNMLPSMTF